MADLIDRQAAINAIAKQMPKSYTSDGSHPGDEEIYKIQEIYVDCIESIEILPSVQPDHIADIGKKVDMMHEYIYKIVKDCDGVNCYIKQGKIIRCKDCKHKHVENMAWTCPFGLPGGENFFCGYGTEPYKGE